MSIEKSCVFLTLLLTPPLPLPLPLPLPRSLDEVDEDVDEEKGREEELLKWFPGDCDSEVVGVDAKADNLCGRQRRKRRMRRSIVGRS